jgi:long-chain acyl-CoA synthetase
MRELASLPQLIERSAARFGDAPALGRAASGPGASLTYTELFESIRRCAAALSAEGVSKGDRVLIALESRPEWAVAFFALLYCEAVVVPVPAETPPAAVAAVTAHAGAVAAIVSERTRALTRDLPGVKTHLIDELMSGTVSEVDRPNGERDTLALLAFTSGSVQAPRAVELTHGNLLSNLDALLQVRQAKPGDALLSMLPLAHMFELMGGLLGPLACGARVVYAASLLPNRLIKWLKEHRITHALSVPALTGVLYSEVRDQLVLAGVVGRRDRRLDLAATLQRIKSGVTEDDMQNIRAGIRSHIGDSFRSFIIGGAAVNPDLINVLDAVGIRTEVGYGLTEASPIVTLGFAHECPHGSAGRPLPGVSVKVDDNGEILVSGANVMKGYFKDADATEAALADGWLRTGDQGRVDENGFLFIVGRSKEAMVTAAGETIYPEEIEPFYGSPLFAEHCVAALRDGDGNDVPILFAVPASNATARAKLESAFTDLRAAAPPNLRVERMVLLDNPLPRTATRKVRRRFLAELWNREESG